MVRALRRSPGYIQPEVPNQPRNKGHEHGSWDPRPIPGRPPRQESRPAALHPEQHQTGRDLEAECRQPVGMVAGDPEKGRRRHAFGRCVGSPGAVKEKPEEIGVRAGQLYGF